MVTIWTLIVSIFLLSVGVIAEPENGICGRMYIRNTPSDLMRLAGCKVIEGSLQIALIESASPEQYKNYSFPLREITGYLLVYNVRGLQTLRHIFPNLTVIRGQEYIHNNYALLVFDMQDMQEIGLPSLTNILKGKVWIYNNPNLCYLDTIDWSRITNDTHGNGIKKNKANSQCPNTCPNSCPKNLRSESLCWSNEDCQKPPMKVCTSEVTQGCCSEHCLGGCTGTGPDKCFVCKNVEYQGNCLSQCPSSTFMYLNRRCVTRDECSRMNFSDPSSNKRLVGRQLVDHGERAECVLECPKGFEEARQKDGVAICRKCEGHCKKICPGLMVDSIEASTQLKGCTRIQGSWYGIRIVKFGHPANHLFVWLGASHYYYAWMKIQIRGYTANLAAELAANLDMIEEIDDYLVVAYTYSLLSLNFFKSLRIIHGKNRDKLEEQNYALVVKSNENIGSLWNETVKIGNKDARVLFHYNPKLCPQKIREFVQLANISNPSREDIGVTNGDKVPCNQKKLEVKIQKMSNSSVTIKWENFRRNLTEHTHLLNYEVFYKEAPNNVTIYDDRDPCGRDSWRVLDIPKMHFVGTLESEPAWEEERLINNLKYYTRYALYVKTVVIPDENSPNNNTGAESDVLYFVTLPFEPSPPQSLTLLPNSSSEVLLVWYPPSQPNGELQHYKIYIKSFTENVDFQDRRNYCEHGRAATKTVNAPEQSTTANSFFDIVANGNKPGDENCCSCSPKPKSAGYQPIFNEVQAEQDIVNAIVDKVFIINPDAQNFISDSTELNTTRNRRRRTISEPYESKEDREDKIFPGDSRPEPSVRQPGPDFNLTHTIDIANATLRRYEFLLKNLTHFTRYTIGVVACRKKSTEIENDTRICSEMKEEHVQTKPSPTADDISPNSIFINVTGQTIRVRWDEPSNPNGVLLAYEIQVKRVDASKAHEPPIRKCISRKQFQDGKNNYTFQDKLHPGNYSLIVKTISLGAESNFTTEKYFLIAEGGEWSIAYILVVIILPIFLIVIMALLLGFYYVRTKGLAISHFITSANPEYMQNVDIPDEWEVTPRDKLEIIQENGVPKELGVGSFGVVYEGILKDFIHGIARQRCAVKTVAKDAPSEDRSRFLQEALLMTSMNCHHVVRLLGVISKSQPTYVVMELMPHGDLKKYLRNRRPDPEYNRGEPPPTIKQTLRMAAEIADGMAYLDSHKLVHRDLAARNCMVAEDRTVKVGDFGMTKDVLETDYYRKSTRGFLPVRWMAPESIRDGVFTSQSDLWSYGVVLWEMATLAAHPYQGLSNDQVLRYVRDGNVMERPENCPNELYDLMIRCWAYEPRTRPTFTEILDWLVPGLDSSFQQVSFYHSPEGIAYRAAAQIRPTQEEMINVRTPLRATCETLSDDEEDPLELDDLRPRKDVSYFLGGNGSSSSGSDDDNDSGDSSCIINTQDEEEEETQSQQVDEEEDEEEEETHSQQVDEDEDEDEEAIATTAKSRGKKFCVSSEESEEEEANSKHDYNEAENGDKNCDDQSEKTCLVCENDEDVALRYTVFACPKCTKFFSAYISERENLVCLADPEKCCKSAFQLKSGRFTKNFCPKCRLEECINVGMRKKVMKLPNGKKCGTWSCDDKSGRCLCCETVLGEDSYEVIVDGVKIDLILDKKNKNFTPPLRPHPLSPQATTAATTTTTTNNNNNNNNLLPQQSTLDQATTLSTKRQANKRRLTEIDGGMEILKHERSGIDKKMKDMEVEKNELIRENDKLSDDIDNILTHRRY